VWPAHSVEQVRCTAPVYCQGHGVLARKRTSFLIAFCSLFVAEFAKPSALILQQEHLSRDCPFLGGMVAMTLNESVHLMYSISLSIS